MKALETTWAGVRFRSRLEARWAVFFDALKIGWEYEPQGYQLPDGQFYLPDFFLPKFHWPLGIYVEVKPFEGSFGKAEMFANGGKGILLLDDSPTLRDYIFLHPDPNGSTSRVPVCFRHKYLPGGKNGDEYRLYWHPEAEWYPDCAAAVSAALSERFRGQS